MRGNCDYCRDTVGFSHLLLIPWYFLRSFSLQPVFAEKAGEKNYEKRENLDQSNSNKSKVDTRDGHFTVDVWRARVLQSTHEALAGR